MKNIILAVVALIFCGCDNSTKTSTMQISFITEQRQKTEEELMVKTREILNKRNLELNVENKNFMESGIVTKNVYNVEKVAFRNLISASNTKFDLEDQFAQNEKSDAAKKYKQLELGGDIHMLNKYTNDDACRNYIRLRDNLKKRINEQEERRKTAMNEWQTALENTVIVEKHILMIKHINEKYNEQVKVLENQFKSLENER